jgi:hypothetical protein
MTCFRVDFDYNVGSIRCLRGHYRVSGCVVAQFVNSDEPNDNGSADRSSSRYERYNSLNNPIVVCLHKSCMPILLFLIDTRPPILVRLIDASRAVEFRLDLTFCVG